MRFLVKFLVSTYRLNRKIYDRGLASLWSITILEPYFIIFLWYVLCEKRIDGKFGDVVNYYSIFIVFIIFVWVIDDKTKIAIFVKEKADDMEYESWSFLGILVIYLIFITFICIFTMVFL